MIKSMTGFGRSKLQMDGFDILVEIKTVNHRYSDIYLKMPRHLNFLEEKIREFVGKHVSRGKIEVFVAFDEYLDETLQVSVDEVLARKYIKAVESIRDTFEIRDDITASFISRFPDVLKLKKNDQDEGKIWKLLQAALSSAMDSLLSMRNREGETLMESILQKTTFIDNYLHQIEIRSPEITKEYKTRLENRIKEMIDQNMVDENRLAMEVSIFAERCNIDEEIVRLRSHIQQFRDILHTGNAVGRKLDFLVQEMNREINTIGSKANDVHITKHVVEVKSEIEKIREQIQNIE